MSKDILIKILNSKYLEPEVILPCPFCGKEAEEDSEYDSNDNRPDGYQYFVQCSMCNARGESFYADATNEMHLNKKQKIEQRAYTKQAKKNAIASWNKRSYLTT